MCSKELIEKSAKFAAFINECSGKNEMCSFMVDRIKLTELLHVILRGLNVHFCLHFHNSCATLKNITMSGTFIAVLWSVITTRLLPHGSSGNFSDQNIVCTVLLCAAMTVRLAVGLTPNILQLLDHYYIVRYIWLLDHPLSIVVVWIATFPKKKRERNTDTVQFSAQYTSSKS